VEPGWVEMDVMVMLSSVSIYIQLMPVHSTGFGGNLGAP